MINYSVILVSTLAVLGGLLLNVQFADAEQPSQQARMHDLVSLHTTAFVDADIVPALGKIAVAGRNGNIFLVETDDEEARVRKWPIAQDVDFTSVLAHGNSSILVGAKDGRIFSFDASNAAQAGLTEVAALSEFDEPVLDMAHSGTSYWAVGARGILANSVDGHVWQDLAIEVASQPMMEIPAEVTGEVSFGVANIDMDNFVINAFVGGETAREGDDYDLYADEGLLILHKPLDAHPAPQVQFEFAPGPAFRRGDVSWNVVLAEGNSVVLAGEFGLILNSDDGGQSWVRSAGTASIGEQSARYWLSGSRRGNRLVLAGAGGVVIESLDGGMTWIDVDSPTLEGAFGVHLDSNDRIMIFGAVGLAGILDDEEWHLADRTQLLLLSWLRTPVALPDGRVLAFGGRSTVIAYSNGVWKRLRVLPAS